MLQHVVLFRLEGQSAEQESAMLAALNALGSEIPALHSFRFAKNLSPRESHFTHVLVSEVADWAALQAYLDHPAHVAAIQAHVAPFQTAKAIADLEL